MFQNRSTRVFVAALISIAIGTLVLESLDSAPLPAGAFSLSEYYRLEPIEKVISSNDVQARRGWKRIEIRYSDAGTYSINQLIPLTDIVTPENIKCHFVICNGLDTGNGQIKPTEKWRKQSTIVSNQPKTDNKRTIHIHIMVDSKTKLPTNFQITRTEELVEALSRKFNIPSESTFFPDGW